MIIILSHFFIFFILSYLNGYFFYKKFFLKLELNIFEVAILGLGLTIFLSQLINFFLPLNDIIIYSNLFISVFYFIKNKKAIIFHIKETPIKKLFVVLLLFILVIFQIYGANFSDDLEHYHFSSIVNMDNFNFIIGNSFLHSLYGTSSLWLAGHSFFNFNDYSLQDIHVFNGLIFFLVLSVLVLKIDLNNDKFILNNILITTIILFFLLKYTRLKEFGIDRQSILIFGYLIIFSHLTIFNYVQKNLTENYIIICFFSLLIISIKIIYLTILVLPFYILLKNYKELYKNKRKLLILIPFILIFLLKNILSSGCLVFPINYTCIDILSWSNEEGARILSFVAETLNKSWASYEGELDKGQYITNFLWFETWFDRTKIEIKDYCLLVLLIVLLVNLKIKNIPINKFKLDKKDALKDLYLVLTLIISLSLLIFVFKNPVIRMNHHMLLGLGLFLVLFSYDMRSINQINQKFFYSILILAFTFNLGKNVKRIIKNDFINNPLLIISPKITEQTYYEINEFKIYRGWYGKAPIGNAFSLDFKHKKYLIFNIIYKSS